MVKNRVEKVGVGRLKFLWMQCPLPAEDMKIALYNNNFAFTFITLSTRRAW